MMKKQTSKHITKFLSLLLLVSMLAGMLTGCGKKEKDNGQAEAGNDTEYTVDLLLHGVPVEESYPYHEEVETAINEKLQKDLGFKVKVNTTSYIDQYDTMLSLDMANQKQYDMIRCLSYMGPMYMEQGAFRDLRPLIDQYAPELWDLIPEATWAEVTYDGKIFGIPTCSFPVSTGLWIRNDWLEKLGKKMPTNLKEFEELMEAMKTDETINPDGKVVPCAGLRDFMELAFLGMFTEHPGDYLEDGKVMPKYFDPGYRAYVEKMAEWYEKGYIDNMYASGDDETINNLMSKNIVGIHVGNVFQLEYTSLNTYNTQMNMDIKWTNPFAADTKKYYSTGCGSDIIAFPVSGKNTEKAFQYYTWFFNNAENADLVMYGKEGVTYERSEDKTTGKEILTVPEDKQSDKVKSCNDLMGFFGANLHTSLQFKYTFGNRPAEAAFAYDACNTQDVMNNYYMDVTNYLRGTPPTDISTKLADSRDMLKERTVEMVVGNRPSTDAEWEDMKNEWIKLGGQDVFDYYTEQYNENKDDLDFLK